MCVCVCVCVCVCESLSRIRHFVTLWTVFHQAPLSMVFSKQKYWSGFPCPPPGDLPDPGFQFVSLKSPELAGRFFTTSTSWDARNLVELRSNPDPGCLSTVNLPFFHINRDATSHPCELFKKDTGCCIGRVSQGAGIQEVLNQCTFPSFETP